MKLYRGRFLRRNIDYRIAIKSETRDAVIHSVDLVNRWAGVRVQGSNKVVRAFYPDNWEKIPYWLKVGNCVRITHTGGQRGRIELVGCGILKPTPIAGGELPVIPTPGDAIISGLTVIAIPEGNWMRVMVTVGYVRFNGVTYYVDAVPLGGDNFVLGMAGVLGEIAYVSGNITAPSTGYYKFVSIAIGSDLVFDVINGTQFLPSAEPNYPTIPSDHLECGRILTYGGMTSIKQTDINVTWSVPIPSILEMTIDDDQLAWGETDTDVTVRVLDQYSKNIYGPGSGWYITLSLHVLSAEYGLITGPGSAGGYSLGFYTGSGANQIVFTYWRNAPGTEHSPTLIARCEGLTAVGGVMLFDSLGEFIP